MNKITFRDDHVFAQACAEFAWNDPRNVAARDVRADQTSQWSVGGNGNWFRDMGGARYCVAYLSAGAVEVLRNGESIGVTYPAGEVARVALAKAAAERHAARDPFAASDNHALEQQIRDDAR